MEVKLVMFKNDEVRKDFLIQNKNTILGRGEDCGLRIPLLSVSRRHCELVKSETELTLRDLGSSNGTYVNNKRVTETVLEAGDLLIIGPVVFTVQVDGKPKDIKPVKIQARKRQEKDRRHRQRHHAPGLQNQTRPRCHQHQNQADDRDQDHDEPGAHHQDTRDAVKKADGVFILEPPPPSIF